MLDINFIRENPSLVQKAAKSKGVNVDIDRLLRIDADYRKHFQRVQEISEERNVLNEQIKKNPNQFDREAAQSLKQKLEKEKEVIEALDKGLKNTQNI